jgi:hypothetical protein
VLGTSANRQDGVCANVEFPFPGGSTCRSSGSHDHMITRAEHDQLPSLDGAAF